MVSPATATPRSDIAIVGMAGRFPGAPDIERLWANLCAGIEGLTRFSDSELIEAGVDPAVVADRDYVPVSGALDGADMFAAAFFGYSAREALIMDPQQRLFLECAWEALESAGHGAPPAATGVFAGVSVSTYLLNRLAHRPDLLDGIGAIGTTIATDKDFLASRVAYKLDLKGPAVVVQSACSSSLVAVHLACRALMGGDCELALAGGCSIDVPQRAGHQYRPEGIYSSDGHCRPFDRNADGMVGGSGVGVVVLKRLDQAVRDRNTIHAVILGSAINNDGAGKVGFTAPSIQGQADVIARAQEIAGVDPESIGFVEAHGTGTALGDPIEVAALTQAFATSQRGYCALGAVKSNIGHLNAAAGIAGLIKTTLVLREGKIPPTLHFQTPNPNIEFDRSPFYVNRQLITWPRSGSVRRAGVSSFGIGGTNAHVVMQEPPERQRAVPGANSGPRLVVLSARRPVELGWASERLASHLEQHPETDLGDVSFTLQVGRKALRYRRAMVCDTGKDAIRALIDAQSQPCESIPQYSVPVTFMFPGQGSQYPNMARELYRRRKVFREQFDLCCDLLRPKLDADLRHAVFADLAPGDAAERLRQTQWTQCALFVVEYALAQQWLALDVEPESMIGHSIGEYVAACIAGVFSLEDALYLVAERGRLLQQTTPGAMLAITLTENDVRNRLIGDLSLAAVNDPQSCVVSGSFEDIARMERQLKVDGIAFQRLQTSHAFHSPLVEPAVIPLRRFLSDLVLTAPTIPFVSNVTGRWIENDEATSPDYWAQHVRHTVRFGDGIAGLLEEPARVFLELGPGMGLSSVVRRHPARRADHRVVSSLPHAQASRSSEQTFLAAVGALWVAGLEVGFSSLDENCDRWRIALPTYPFDRQRYWVEAVTGTAGIASVTAAEPQRLSSAAWAHTPSWRRGVCSAMRDLTGVPLVVFGDAKTFGEVALQHGRRLVRVAASGRYRRLGPDSFEIDPWKGEHYVHLIAEIAAAGKLQLLHLWAVPGVIDRCSGSGRDPGFDTLLLLAQALGRLAQSSELAVVTDGLYDVTGEEHLNPDQATILGPCRVIPLEFPGFHCRNIDICRRNEQIGAETVRQILRELAAEDGVPVVAWRGPHRWLPAYEPLPLPPSASAAELLPTGGTYVVTGGLSGIGAELAEHLCVHHQAQVAILSRTQLPPRDGWNETLMSAEAGSPVARAIRTVQRLEATGGRILVLAADVADRSMLAQALDRTRRELGPIDGVVHAAGIAGGGAIQLKSLVEARQVMAAKVEGSRNLFELLQDQKPRFLFLCSSLAAELGGFGQVDYCAANAFQDAFACAKNGSMLVQAIDWDTWSETGMAVHTAAPAELRASREEALRLGLKSDEGRSLFPSLLASRQARVLISTRSLHDRLQAGDPLSPAEPAGPPIRVRKLQDLSSPRPHLSAPFVAPRTPTEAKLAGMWRALFGLESIGIHDDFFELGGHSLLATQLLNRVRKSFPSGGRLSLAMLFDSPTIEELAAHIEPASAAADGGQLPSLRDLAKRTAEERRAFFKEYLLARVGIDVAADPITAIIDIAAIAAQIIWELRRDFGLVFYPQEFAGASSLDDVVDCVATAAAGPPPPNNKLKPADFSGLIQGCLPPTDPQVAPNPGMLFVLSAPRSGSTLLRLMLAGHPRLFCPPELALLSAPDMTHWKDHQAGIFELDGLTRAWMELHGMDAAQARAQIERLTDQGTSIRQVYRHLQTACGDRLLVDKSPAYALDEKVLARAEKLFAQPRYLILIRHPHAVIGSMVHYRMDRLLASGVVSDPWHFAEYVWAVCNLNLENLALKIAERCYRITYEDLVSQPEQTMRNISEFLELDYHEAMLEPYAGGRMIDGPGDPDIFQHDRIETDLANNWQRNPLPFTLQPETLQLAARFGYEYPPAEDSFNQPLPSAEPSISLVEAARVAARVDALSDVEVEVALRALLPEQQRNN